MAFDNAEKDYWGQRHHSFMVHYARVWPGALTVQLVACCNAFVRFPYPMQKLHVLLNHLAWTTCVISPDIYSVSNGFTVIWLFGQFRWSSCNKLAFSQTSITTLVRRLCCCLLLSRQERGGRRCTFCCRFQGETLGVLTFYSDTHPREHNSKRSTYHQWCALPLKRALVTHSPYILPKYTFLNLSSDVIRSTACFRLCDHILRFETAARNQSKPPTCDLCDADDIQDEGHVLIHCVNPHSISFRRIYDLWLPQQEPTMCLHVWVRKAPLHFFLHELFALNKQASSLLGTDN